SPGLLSFRITLSSSGLALAVRHHSGRQRLLEGIDLCLQSVVSAILWMLHGATAAPTILHRARRVRDVRCKPRIRRHIRRKRRGRNDDFPYGEPIANEVT